MVIDLMFRDDLPQTVGGKESPTPMASYAECLTVLQDLFDTLGFGPTRLSKLIGTGQTSVVSHWKNARFRPSQAYCIRMLKIVLDELKSVDPANRGNYLLKIRTYDWRTWEPEYYPGWERNEQQGNHNLRLTERGVSEENRLSDREAPESLAEF